MADCCEQLELPLFTPLSFEEILSQKNIRNLTFAVNSRLKNGWRVIIQASTGSRTLVVPAYFENAPMPVKNALIEWALLPPLRKSGKSSIAFKRKKELERLAWNYGRLHGKPAARVRILSRCSFQAVGRRYDLKEVFNALNTDYFNGRLSSFVRWNKSRRRSYQTVFTDEHGRRHNLISIAQTYNRPDVPRFAIEGIVFHEMSHIEIPPYTKNSRAIVHGPEFKRMERSFPYYSQWRQWEREQMK